MSLLHVLQVFCFLVGCFTLYVGLKAMLNARRLVRAYEHDMTVQFQKGLQTGLAWAKIERAMFEDSDVLNGLWRAADGATWQGVPIYRPGAILKDGLDS